MASLFASRTILRSVPLRNSAGKLTSRSKTNGVPPPFRTLKSPPTPSPPRLLRSPVEMSCAVETLMPMHSVTASAVMNSLLSVSLRSRSWLSEGGDETR